MLRKTMIAGLGLLGLVLAGTAAGTTPATAGYGCGPWNNFCRPVCGPWNAWCDGYLVDPSWGYDWNGGYDRRRNWGQSYGHNKWNNEWNDGGGHGNWNGNGRGHGNWNGNHDRGKTGNWDGGGKGKGNYQGHGNKYD